MPLSKKAQDYCDAVWGGHVETLALERVAKLERLRAGLVHIGDIYSRRGFWSYLEPDVEYIAAVGAARKDCLLEAYSFDHQALSQSVVGEILEDTGYRVESAVTQMIGEKIEEMKKASGYPTLDMTTLPPIADVSTKFVEVQGKTMKELKRLLTIRQLRDENDFRPDGEVNRSSQSNSMREQADDRKFAKMAIEEARKSVPEDDGKAHPLVGAVVVKNGVVLARAHRGEVRGNHAEYIALEKKLSDATVAGATVYTTLEPCTTRSNPKIPCAERIIERKAIRVVMGMLDPDPRIKGNGQQTLRSANVITDFFPPDLMAEVEEMNRAFIRSFAAHGRPLQLVQLTLAYDPEKWPRCREFVLTEDAFEGPNLWSPPVTGYGRESEISNGLYLRVRLTNSGAAPARQCRVFLESIGRDGLLLERDESPINWTDADNVELRHLEAGSGAYLDLCSVYRGRHELQVHSEKGRRGYGRLTRPGIYEFQITAKDFASTNRHRLRVVVEVGDHQWDQLRVVSFENN